MIFQVADREKKMQNEKLPSNYIPLNDAGSEHCGDLPRAVQDGSQKSIPWGPPVNSSRKQMGQQADRGRIEANRASDRLGSDAREALAEFLSTPAPMRQFKSLKALTEHFKISRMTVHRWQHDPVVLQRAEILSKQNRLRGVLLARLNYESAVRAQIKRAIRGDTKAARYVHEIAWPEDTSAEAKPTAAVIRVVYADSPEPLNKQEGVQQEPGSSSDPAPQ
jgi:hypothetical protein